MSEEQLLHGRIVAAHGRQYVVALDGDGRLILSFPRGKKSDVACGDRVDIQQVADDQGVIETVLPRRSLFYRASEVRQKLIAANVDLVVVVVAVEPDFSDEVVTCALLAAESEEIDTLIVLNKCDLLDRLPQAREKLAMFADIGYPVLELSAQTDAQALLPYLNGHISVLVGQSGMGKSTIINTLVPGAGSATREISRALNSGKHTTTHATLYNIDAQSAVIDSPGLQEFGLGHLDRQEIEHAFREFRPLLAACRFRDCRHIHEPDCALVEALKNGSIHPRRFALFQALTKDKN